jgi:hypothetical protein
MTQVVRAAMECQGMLAVISPPLMIHSEFRSIHFRANEPTFGYPRSRTSAIYILTGQLL